MKTSTPYTVPAPAFHGILERREFGLVILSPADRQPTRRAVYVNSYGGSDFWMKVRDGAQPSHHLWGVPHLVRLGYEVALAEPLSDFYFYRNPLPHDLRLFKLVRSWLGRDGIIYCGHNTLYWLPLLRALGFITTPIVSLLFAREPLNLSVGHAGVIGLTTAASEHAAMLAPRARIGHLAWGADLQYIAPSRYDPRWFICCGATMRDHETLSLATRRLGVRTRVISRQPLSIINWPGSVDVVSRDTFATHADWMAEHYSGSIASIIPIKRDDRQYIACGFTELLEAMASARPVILTKTGALPTEVNIEQHDCGVFVPPGDASALAEAMEYLASDPQRARAMGENGRALAERYYNIDRFGSDLYRFLDCL